MSNHIGSRWITEQTSSTDERLPDRHIGPFLPVSDADIDSFNDAFSDEIDSAFASRICCCDLCYGDFRAHWPDVSFREMEFQAQSIEVLWAVEYSRLPGIYSPAEISTFCRFVRCERCAQFVPHNLWIYEHRFSNSDGIETAIDELLTIGNETPFLLLEHKFARQVLAQVRVAAASPFRLQPGTTLFRARVAADVARLGQAPNALATYAPPPAQFVGEGRFNHAGTPMLYLAGAPEVAAAEIGMPGEPCHIAELKLLREVRLLDLVDLDEDAPGYELMRALASSALLAAPHSGSGWLKRQYVFSRFVADCARSAGFDAIRYGSTKNVDGANIVILVPSGDIASLATLVGVQDMAGLSPAERY